MDHIPLAEHVNRVKPPPDGSKPDTLGKGKQQSPQQGRALHSATKSTAGSRYFRSTSSTHTQSVEMPIETPENTQPDFFEPGSSVEEEESFGDIIAEGRDYFEQMFTRMQGTHPILQNIHSLFFSTSPAITRSSKH